MYTCVSSLQVEESMRNDSPVKDDGIDTIFLTESKHKHTDTQISIGT